ADLVTGVETCALPILKNCAALLATAGPMPSIAVICSTLALASASSEPSPAASASAATSPTKRIPRPVIRRASGRFFESAIAVSRSEEHTSELQSPDHL